MKQNLNSKKRITGYFKKVIDNAKPIQEKIEKVLAKNPTFQKWAERSAPWRRKIRAGVIVNLKKARAVTDAAKKELQDLRQQYKAEPKKAFKNTITKAQSFAKDSWEKRRHNKQTSTKGSAGHGTKTDKRESAAS